MICFLIVLAVVGAGVYILLKSREFDSIGTTTGVCVRVDTELSEDTESAIRDQVRGRDRRSYRPYVEYEWEGVKYVGKSFFSYGTARYFPGDKVEIAVHESDKGSVKILRALY